jgi:hypothetical protein
MARPQNQNPRGERLTSVLLWQGLMLSPPFLDGKTTSIKDKLRQEGLIRQSVATARLH